MWSVAGSYDELLHHQSQTLRNETNLTTELIRQLQWKSKLKDKSEKAKQWGYRNQFISSRYCVYMFGNARVCLNLFSLGRCLGKREAWTCEPNSYPFCLSSPISSLSSLKVRRLCLRNKALMVWHLWNAWTKIRSKSNFTYYTGQFSQRFATSHKSKDRLDFLVLSKQYHCSKWVQSNWTTIKESSIRCHHARAPIKTSELWWIANWFAWLIAGVSDLHLFTAVLKS